MIFHKLMADESWVELSWIYLLNQHEIKIPIEKKKKISSQILISCRVIWKRMAERREEMGGEERVVVRGVKTENLFLLSLSHSLPVDHRIQISGIAQDDLLSV